MERRSESRFRTILSVVAIVAAIAMPTINLIYTSRQSAKEQLIELSVKMAIIEQRLDDHIAGTK